jgi:hypothetical protein
MVSLQCGIGIATSQTFVAVILAKRLELLGGKTARSSVLRSPPHATIVGFSLFDFSRVFLGPPLAASYYFFTLAFVVSKFVSSYALLVVRRPLLFVLGYLILVFFLVLSARLGPMRQIRSGFLILSVLL